MRKVQTEHKPEIIEAAGGCEIETVKENGDNKLIRITSPVFKGSLFVAISGREIVDYNQSMSFIMDTYRRMLK